MLLKPQPTIPPPQQFQDTASFRVAQLRDLCEKHGAKLIILVPPTPSSADAVQQMTIASQKAGVNTLVPIDPTALSVKYYQSDELHLNSAGAQLFTSALATFLPKAVGHEPVASPN